MRNKKLLFSAIILLVMGLIRLQAQEAFSASGGNAIGTGATTSYSIGQVINNTNTGTNGSVTQSIQQSYEITVVSELEKAKIIVLQCTTYPNPSTDYLILEVKDFELFNLSFKLYNMSGKLLQNKKITNSHTKIVMSNFVPATYFVKVIENNKEIKTFKCIKN